MKMIKNDCLEVKEWILQAYDTDTGYVCKLPRYFTGTEIEVYNHIRENLDEQDYLCGRITLAYDMTRYTEDTIPQYIDLNEEGEFKFMKFIKQHFEALIMILFGIVIVTTAVVIKAPLESLIFGIVVLATGVGCLFLRGVK